MIEKYLTKLSFSVFVFFLIFGCKENPSSRSNIGKNDIPINLLKIGSPSEGDLFDSIELTPLSGNSASLIKNVDKLVHYGHKYYILDAEMLSVLIFDERGNFVLKINNEGNGPGEYNLLYDFNINKFTNRIELLNPRGFLIEYNLDGAYIKTTKLPLLSTHRFVIINEDVILFYSKTGDYKLDYYSRTSNSIIKKDFRFPDFVLETPMIASKSSPFNELYDGSITFFQGFSNIVYSIVDYKLERRFAWDFGDQNLDLEDFPEGKSIEGNVSYLRKCKCVHSFSYFLENERFIFTRFLYNRLWITMVYNKTTSDYFLISKFKEKVAAPPFPVLFEGGIMYAAHPAEIQLLVKPEMIDDKNREILKKIRMDDNPVIIRYYLKKDL